MTAKVVIELRRDEEQLNELRRDDLGLVSTAVIANSYLRLPVRFSVDDVDVLVQPKLDDVVWLAPRDGSPPIETRLNSDADGSWRAIPVLAFSAALDSGLARLSRSGKATVTVPEGGVLRFERYGATVRLTGETGMTFEIPVTGLEAAIQRFRESLARLIKDVAPDLGWRFDLAPPLQH